MARFGETLIDVETIYQDQDLGKHLEAIRNLARMAHLVTWGLRWAERHEMESCGGPLIGDDLILDSLLWPLEQIALDAQRLHGKEEKPAWARRHLDDLDGGRA